VVVREKTWRHFTLKMRAAWTSETLVPTTRPHTPEDLDLKQDEYFVTAAKAYVNILIDSGRMDNQM
jgi:hypothetical protein